MEKWRSGVFFSSKNYLPFPIIWVNWIKQVPSCAWVLTQFAWLLCFINCELCSQLFLWPWSVSYVDPLVSATWLCSHCRFSFDASADLVAFTYLPVFTGFVGLPSHRPSTVAANLLKINISIVVRGSTTAKQTQRVGSQKCNFLRKACLRITTHIPLEHKLFLVPYEHQLVSHHSTSFEQVAHTYSSPCKVEGSSEGD